MSNAGSSEELREVVARLEAEVAALQASRRRLAEAAHSERRAFERDLHDGVQQHLVALAVDLQRLAGLIDGDAAAAKALVAELRSNLRDALDEATRLARRISPPITDWRGLAAAVRSAANQVGVAAHVELPAQAGDAHEIIAALYWTWVDAIASAPRGSDATFSTLDADGGRTFTITIAGQWTEGEIDRLRDRIEALDGRLAVDDSHVGSSRLQVWLPLPR